MATDKYLNKTGLQRFWAGIKTKIAEKAKITLTGVDPGEGASLAAGEYIAVYGESGWLDKVYPVGSIYLTVAFSTAAQVATALGGTWVAWGAGRVPVGVDTSQTEFDTVEETGGAKKHTHTIDARLRMWFGVAGLETSKAFDIIDENGNGGAMTQNTGLLSRTTCARNSAAQTGTTSFTHDGFGQKIIGKTYSDSSLQPYITCYMYKRTA